VFERFVRESRRAVTCAQDEARALGAERVEPEHLLLALAGGCGDPAACAIGEAGLSREAIAGAIEQDLVATLEVVGVPASVVASVPARPGADRPRLNLAARGARAVAARGPAPRRPQDRHRAPPARRPAPTGRNGGARARQARGRA